MHMLSRLLTAVPEVRYSSGMSTAEVLRTDEDLAAWDWVAELEAQDRTRLWLARKSDTPYQTVYRRARGEQKAPIDWLRSVARILGRAE